VDGAAQLLSVVEAAETSLRAALGSAEEDSATDGTVAEWSATLTAIARLLATAGAAQNLTITRLAAIEIECADDGTLVERHRSPGHVSLDAAAIVAGTLCTTTAHAENRVHEAVRLAADGPRGSRTATGLEGLHVAMRDGRLDAYRAGIVADELVDAPPEVAESTVAALDPYFDHEDGPRLRRRCRRMLARVSPDLLRQRARRARSECRLERWASEPGVDTWHGTFPSEEAVRAWAALDALAHRYVADGVCDRIDRARAKALTDLVTGNATITTELVLTVPRDVVEEAPTAAELPPATRPADAPRCDRPAAATARATTDAAPTADPPDVDLVEVPGPRPSEPLLVPRTWLVGLARTAREAAAATRSSRARRRALRFRTCHPTTGVLLADQGGPSTDEGPGPYRPPRRLAELVRSRDGRCRFPGCHVSARFCDLDHVRPWPLGPTSAANLVCLCRRHHRTKQQPGWRVHLDDLGALWWTDPTGRVRASEPQDLLHPVVLRGAAGTGSPAPLVPALDLSDGPHGDHEHPSPSEGTMPRTPASRATRSTGPSARAGPA
jgi:hypothetical protein